MTRAIVYTEQGTVETLDIDMPPPGPGEVQVRTDYSSISSGTEGWVLHNRFTWAPTTYPCVPGYQRSGTVVAVGEGVSDWQAGDRVMAANGSWSTSPVPFWGAHAELANAKEHAVYRLPAGCGPVDAAGAVVAQVGYNAAYRAQFEPGDWVVVYGDGVIGQFGAQAARSRGARTILVGHRQGRLDIGQAHSADHAIRGDDETVEKIQQITGQEYVSVIIDTVQRPEVVESYALLLEQGVGQIVFSGFSPDEPWASMQLMHKRELTTHYIQGINRPRMEATLQLMADGKMALTPLLTHRVDVDQASAMYRMIDEKSEPFLGILFEW